MSNLTNKYKKWTKTSKLIARGNGNLNPASEIRSFVRKDNQKEAFKRLEVIS